LNTKHHVIAKKIEDEVKGSLNLEKKIAKKCIMCIQVQYNKKIGPKGPLKNDYVLNLFFCKTLFF
jgi:hypothetical protein